MPVCLTVQAVRLALWTLIVIFGDALILWTLIVIFGDALIFGLII